MGLRKYIGNPRNRRFRHWKQRTRKESSQWVNWLD